MKWNCYDLLDYYNTEKNDMPALKTQPIQTDAVLERVAPDRLPFCQTGEKISPDKMGGRGSCCGCPGDWRHNAFGSCRLWRIGCVLSEPDRRCHAAPSGKDGISGDNAGQQL